MEGRRNAKGNEERVLAHAPQCAKVQLRKCKTLRSFSELGTPPGWLPFWFHQVQSHQQQPLTWRNTLLASLKLASALERAQEGSGHMRCSTAWMNGSAEEVRSWDRSGAKPADLSSCLAHGFALTLTSVVQVLLSLAWRASAFKAIQKLLTILLNQGEALLHLQKQTC